MTILLLMISIDPELKMDDGIGESNVNHIHIGPTHTLFGGSTICCCCIFLTCFIFMILLPIDLDAGGEFSKLLRSKARFHRNQGLYQVSFVDWQ